MPETSNQRRRNLISLKNIAERLGCSVATARRRSKTDPNLPALFNVNNLLFGYDDQLDAYIEAASVRKRAADQVPDEARR